MYFNFRQLSPDDVTTARANAELCISAAYRDAANMRTIAEKFDGAHVTKALAPKIAAALKDVKEVRIDIPNYGIDKYIWTLIRFDNWPGASQDVFALCPRATRRIDGEALREGADKREADAHKWEDHLSRIDAAARIYNEICDMYAEIAPDARELFAHIVDMPWPDCDLERRHKALTPEEFARKYA